MISRSARETVMLEALERLRRHCSCLLGRGLGVHDHQCASAISNRAIATVKAMDEAELRVGPVTT